MIPKIFISSTISDLHYLRDAIRDVVSELGYNPIMSEYGDVGYISQIPVTEACFNSMSESQIAILIIGKKYGSNSSNGISVTQNEFRTARENGIPVLCLIEKEVMAYKKVYDNNGASATTIFPDMDSPKQTFQFINEFSTSHVNNGYRLFETANDVRYNIRIQLANFFGELLKDKRDPIKSDIKDIISELKALKNELTNKDRNAEYISYQRTTRLIIDDYYKSLFALITSMFRGNLDRGIGLIIEAEDFERFLKIAGWTLSIENVPDLMVIQMGSQGYSSLPDVVADPIRDEFPEQIISFSFKEDEKKIFINKLTYKHFKRLFSIMKEEIKVTAFPKD